LVGLGARLWLTWLLPHAFYGLDSYSYFAFPANVLFEGSWEFPDKRRWFYPLFVAPFLAAGVKPLALLALAQRLLMLATIPGIAYGLRCTCRRWRWWIVPATLLWTLLPLSLNFEQQLTGHAFVLAGVTASIAGWCAWVRGNGVDHWRWFAAFGPLALAVLTKPVVWFLLPGLALGLLVTGLWRRLRWWYALPALLVLALMSRAGSDATKTRHLVNSAFPLIRLDTPAQADLKRDAADFVRQTRAALPYYYLADEGPHKDLIENPGIDPARYPAWATLSAGKNARAERARAYSALAWEGIRHEPHLLAWIAAQRAVFLLRQGMVAEELSGDRDDPAGLREMIEEDRAERRFRLRAARRLFSLDPADPVADAEALYGRHYGGLRRPEAYWLFAWCNHAGSALRCAQLAPGQPDNAPLSGHRPTWFGCLVLAGLLVGLAPGRRTLLLPWILALVGFFAGSLMLISGVPLRQIAPAVPLLLLLPWIGLDAIVNFVLGPCRDNP
jgi:hypothetical protein